jgi:large subunit ribosomal protein L24
MKLKKGDEIIVIVGKDKGRKGKVEKVFPKDNTVLVPGINVYKRHAKKRDDKHPGGIISLPKALNASKVMFLCPSCGQMTRIGYKNLKDEKVRMCRKCGQKI